jgi:hypothetical protein
MDVAYGGVSVSTAVESFDLLCECLRRGHSETEWGILKEKLSSKRSLWPRIIDQANQHYLGPALGLALKQGHLAEVLPEDASDFLEDSLHFNRLRNQKIKAQAEELVKALNSNGIVPVVLKGGVYLFEPHSKAFDTRMMVDIDLLVAPEDWDRSIQTAHGIGYEVLQTHQPWTHDYHPLGRSGDDASVEFHRDVGKQRGLLSAKAALAAARSLDAPNHEIRALSPTHRVLHNIFHGAIQDRAYALARIPLRSLHDLCLILENQGDRIDWQDITTRLEKRRYHSELSAYISQAERCLDLKPLPKIQSTVFLEMHWQICRTQLQMNWLKSAVDLYATLTHPLARATVEYVQGDASNHAVLQVKRLRHLWFLTQTHGFGVFSKLAKVYRRMYRPS